MNHNSNILWIIVRRMRTPLIVIIVTFAISITGMVIIPGVDANGNVYHMSFFDATYFVTFMASTIGFGEVPYEFTYAQRFWVLFSIYITVIGWFYAIGTIVSLIQDKKLLAEIAYAKFQKKVEGLKEPFIIILGYNHITKELIQKLSLTDKRIVVIDKDQNKIDELELENFIPEVYSIAADVEKPEVLKLAGIKKRNCKAMVTLFNNDFKNTKIALLAKLLNERINLIVKSTTEAQTEHLQNLGIQNIIDPFQVIANRFYLAINSPSLWLLEMMLFEHELYFQEKDRLPKGKYIVCGYGRMGKALECSLKKANLPCEFIDLKSSTFKDKKNSAIFGDAEDKKLLQRAGIEEATAVVSATKDDLINLTILLTAKKLNPDIYTIGRENTLDDLTIFQSAKIDRVYMLEDIISDYVHKVVALPLSARFLEYLNKQTEEWGEKVIDLIRKRVTYNPIYFEIRVSRHQTRALYDYLKEGNEVTLKDISKSLNDNTKPAKIFFLLVKNRKEQITYIPDENYSIKVSDSFLIASTQSAKDDFELLTNNINELNYILTGKDIKYGLLKNYKEKR